MEIIYKILVEISEAEMSYLKTTDWNDEKSRLNKTNELCKVLVEKGIIYEVSDECDCIFYLTAYGRQLIQSNYFY